MFLGPAWLYCVSAWGWSLAKCGESGVLVFACWLNLGGLTLCAVGTHGLCSDSAAASLGVGLCVQPLFIFRSCEGSAQKLSLWLLSVGTEQGQQVPVLEAVWPSFSAGKGSSGCDWNPSEQGWVLGWALWVDPGGEGLSRNPEVYSAILYVNALNIQVF